jgi:hypothetical protein
VAELALGEPPDLAGPKIYTAPELIKSYLNAVRKRTWEELLADRS